MALARALVGVGYGSTALVGIVYLMQAGRRPSARAAATCTKGL
jgi:hypothetical protein